jgi:hypothetical protein
MVTWLYLYWLTKTFIKLIQILYQRFLQFGIIVSYFNRSVPGSPPMEKVSMKATKMRKVRVRKTEGAEKGATNLDCSDRKLTSNDSRTDQKKKKKKIRSGIKEVHSRCDSQSPWHPPVSRRSWVGCVCPSQWLLGLRLTKNKAGWHWGRIWDLRELAEEGTRMIGFSSWVGLPNKLGKLTWLETKAWSGPTSTKKPILFTWPTIPSTTSPLNGFKTIAYGTDIRMWVALVVSGGRVADEQNTDRVFDHEFGHPRSRLDGPGRHGEGCEDGNDVSKSAWRSNRWGPNPMDYMSGMRMQASESEPVQVPSTSRLSFSFR